MNANQIREWSSSEIEKKIEDIYKEMFNLRFQAAVGQNKQLNQLKYLRRDIARLKTVLNERKDK